MIQYGFVGKIAQKKNVSVYINRENLSIFVNCFLIASNGIINVCGLCSFYYA